jgi:magnesium-transporting ATPase (P-type)
MLGRTAVVAVVMAAGALGLFLVEHESGEPPDRAQTLAVTGIALFQCTYLLACRNPGGPVREVGWFTNPWVYAGIAALLALQAGFVYAPFMHTLFGTASLGPDELALAALFALAGPVVARAPWPRDGRRVPS